MQVIREYHFGEDSFDGIPPELHVMGEPDYPSRGIKRPIKTAWWVRLLRRLGLLKHDPKEIEDA